MYEDSRNDSLLELFEVFWERYFEEFCNFGYGKDLFENLFSIPDKKLKHEIKLIFDLFYHFIESIDYSIMENRRMNGHGIGDFGYLLERAAKLQRNLDQAKKKIAKLRRKK